MRFWSFDLSPTLTRDVTFSPFRRAIWPFLGGGAGYFAFALYGFNVAFPTFIVNIKNVAKTTKCSKFNQLEFLSFGGGCVMMGVHVKKTRKIKHVLKTCRKNGDFWI